VHENNQVTKLFQRKEEEKSNLITQRGLLERIKRQSKMLDREPTGSSTEGRSLSITCILNIIDLFQRKEKGNNILISHTYIPETE
jgi:hypothetical protein